MVFQYGNFLSSQYDLIIGIAGSGGGVENIPTYGQVEVYTDTSMRRNTPYFFGTKLTDKLEFPMQIVNRNGDYYTSPVQQIIQGYLFNRRNPELLTILEWDKTDTGYLCLFNNPEKIQINGKCIGWNFTVQVMSQYSITSLKTTTINCVTDTTMFDYWNHSDVEDYIKPKFDIVLSSAVSFIRIENFNDNNRIFQVTGMRVGEKFSVNNDGGFFYNVNSGDDLFSKMTLTGNAGFFRARDGLNRLRINGRCTITISAVFQKAVGGY